MPGATATTRRISRARCLCSAPIPPTTSWPSAATASTISPSARPERLMAYARILAEGAAHQPKAFYYMTTRSGIFRRDVLALLREHGIPVIGGTRQGLGAIDRLAWWSEVRAPLPPSASAVTSRLAAMRAEYRPTLHEGDAKRLLAEAGLPVVSGRL